MNAGWCDCQIKFNKWVFIKLHSYFFLNRVVLETDNFHWESLISLCNPLYLEPIEELKVTSKIN